MPRQPRPAIYRTPEYEQRGDKWVPTRAHYFGTVKETVAFAVEQMKKRGGKGYSHEALTREHVAELLSQHVPVPNHWTSR